LVDGDRTGGESEDHLWLCFEDHVRAPVGLEPPPEIDFETADLPPLARSFYESNRKVHNERIKAALDYTLRYPSYREGFSAILAAEQRR
jgi:hypothetical protein